MRRADAPARPTPDHRAVLVLSANNCWNLAHFRKGLIERLTGAGYRIVVLAPLDDDAERLRERGIEVRGLSLARSGMNPLADARLIWRYVRELRAIRPAAYCGFTIKPNIYGALAARVIGIPVINNVTGLGTAFLSSGLTWAVVKQLYRLALRRSHVIFVHNQADREFLIGERLARPDQARVIPGSGVDIAAFRPEAAAEPPSGGGATFLFIGRLLADKGVREFIEAARILRAKMPTLRFQLLGKLDPGNPSSVSAADLEGWIDQGLVEHFGEQSDVRPFIRAATAIVLPSYREGMSRALLEGAAMAKPLVGTDVPGSRELVEEGVTGALCDARDAGSLASAMERIAGASPELLADFGRNARSRVEREFSEEVVVRAYLDVLAQLRVRPQ